MLPAPPSFGQEGVDEPSIETDAPAHPSLPAVVGRSDAGPAHGYGAVLQEIHHASLGESKPRVGGGTHRGIDFDVNVRGAGSIDHRV